MRPRIEDADLAHCREAIRTGSRSFHAASKLLPRAVRDPALALYAFCRLADDEVDERGSTAAKARAVAALGARLDAVYRGAPHDAPEDRAFAAVVERFEMPRALPEALLEGLAWDAQGRRCETLSDVRAYGARVAGAVGAMMAVLMGVREAGPLARACDLGIAMQLTNIARDVGEDARAGRLYLPLDWLAEAGLSPEAFLADPRPTSEVRAMVARLLSEARRIYRRSEAGIPALPRGARPGIYAARHIYAGIGAAVRRQGHDSITVRARTTPARKIGWLGVAGGRAAASLVLPRAATLYAPPVEEAAFLVAAAALPGRRGRAVGRGPARRADGGPCPSQGTRHVPGARRVADLTKGAQAGARHEHHLVPHLPCRLPGRGRDRRRVPARPVVRDAAQAPWTPPNWVFPVAWTSIYLLISFAGARVAVMDGNAFAMAFWAAQAAFSTLWTPVFFGLRRLKGSLLVMAPLWLAVLGATVSHWQMDLWAGLAFLPYLAWVTVAAALNLSVARLNPDVEPYQPGRA